MKVTVCFEDVRVVVPCGDGQLTVAELTELAILRYKKAINKTQEVWISVLNLKSSDGGILDPDDKVVDVIDDKEQITATFNINFPHLHQNNGDGTSNSSVGTSSPDVFRWGKDNVDLPNWNSVVTGEQPTGGDPLMEVIRVDSSPKRPYDLPLNTKVADSSKDKTSIQQAKSEMRHLQTIESNSSTKENEVDSPGRSFDDSAFRAFMRTASRKSLNNGSAMLQWLEAQERVQDGYMRTAREEPIGSSDEAEIIDKIEIERQTCTGTLVEIKNPGCALGIHVAPCVDESGRNLGLQITFVEPGGYAETTRSLQTDDCILEINGTSLEGVSFSRAQELLRDALKVQTICLRLLRPRVTSSSLADDKASKDRDGEPRTDDAIGKFPGASNSPSSKVPPVPPIRNPSTALTTKPKFTPLHNTRVIGQKLRISLKKGDQGLGFSVTTRDNPAGGDSPIYIKNILPQGAAIFDGRLRSGDRLLEIGGIAMAGKTQSDAVAALRDVKIGDSVELVVSRHSDDQQNEDIDPAQSRDGTLNTDAVPPARDQNMDVPTSGVRRPAKSSSGSESESTRRASVTTGNSDFDGVNWQGSNGFDREGLGRRSMSEKRRAFIDPKSSAFFQKLKDGKNKDSTLKRSSSVESILNVSRAVTESNRLEDRLKPATIVEPKRSASFKSLNDENERLPSRDFDRKVVPLIETRSRRWNESFRSAIDRSYADQNIIAPPDAFKTEATRSRAWEQGPAGAPRTVSKAAEFLAPSRNHSPANVERKRISPTNWSHGYSAQHGQPTHRGPRPYDQNPNNVPIGRNGYLGYREMSSTQKMNEFYSGNPVPANSASISNYPSAFVQRSHPPIGSQPCLSSLSRFADHTGSLDSPKRNNALRLNRPDENSRRNNVIESRTPTGERLCGYNDVRLKAYASNAYPNASVQNEYPYDATNVTKSSYDLWTSSDAGVPTGARLGYPAYNHFNDPRFGLPPGNGVLGNRRKDETQRQRGFVISSGALV